MTKTLEVPIPDLWREVVATILRSGDARRIQTTQRSDKDWNAPFPDSWEYERFEAIAETLERGGVVGRRVCGMTPPGEVYEFFFVFRSVNLYGKVNLLSSGNVVVVYSNHLPDRGDL